MLQLLEIQEQESYIQLITKLNKNFDTISLSSGGDVGPAGPIGPRGLLGPSGLRGIRFFMDGDDLSESIKGDWLIYDDGSVEFKDENGSWQLIDNFNLKGPIGLQGESGETSELWRYNGANGDAFNGTNSYVPNMFPTTNTNFPNKNFITLKKDIDTFVLGAAFNIKDNFAHFPTENEIGPLIVIQNELIPNGKNGISIGSIGLIYGNTPNTALGDYDLFAHLWVDDDGSFKIVKDHNSIVISSNDSLLFASNDESILIGNDENDIRTIDLIGNKIELVSSQNSSLKVNSKIEISSNNLNILTLNSISNPTVNQESYFDLIQGTGNLSIKLKKIDYDFNTGFGTTNFQGSLGILNLNAPNESTSTIGGLISTTNKDIYFTKEGSIYLGETANNAFGSSIYDLPGSIFVGGDFKLNKNVRPRFESSFFLLSDDEGKVSLYDENGPTGINPQVDTNGFKFGIFGKDLTLNTISLLGNSTLDLGEDRVSGETHYLTIKGSNSKPGNILLNSDYNLNPFIEFKKKLVSNDVNSKFIKFGLNTSLNRNFELPKGQGSGGVFAMLNDPLNNFSENWSVFQNYHKNNNTSITELELESIGGLVPTDWYFNRTTAPSNFFDDIKLSSGRDFNISSIEHLTPYSKVSVQRLNKEIALLKFSITLLFSDNYAGSYDAINFFQVNISERFGVLKPIGHQFPDLSYAGQDWFNCSIYTPGYLKRPTTESMTGIWDNPLILNGLKRFVIDEDTHNTLNSTLNWNGQFTVDRIGNNKTGLQFSFDIINVSNLKAGISFTGSCLCHYYKENNQSLETFTQELFTEES